MIRRPIWPVMVVGALVAFGIARLALAISPPNLDIFADEARHGLSAMHILRGEIPVFFYGQAYAGTLSNFLLAPLFFLLGASPLILKLLSFLLALIHVGLTGWLAYRFLGPRTAAFAVVLAAIPPPVLFHWHHKAQLYYNVNLVLQDIILLQTLVLLSSPRRTDGRWLILGLAGGLAIWTHYLAVVFLLPPAVALVLHDPRVVWDRRGWLAGGGFLIGTLPVWAYNLPHDFQSLRNLATGAGQTSPAHIARHLADFFLSGLPTLIAGRPPGGLNMSLWVAAVALSAFGLLWTLTRLRQPVVALCWGVLLLTFSLNILTAYGRTLITDDVPHLVPSYIGLTLLLAHAAATLDRQAPLTARLGVGLLLWANVALTVYAAALFGYRVESPGELQLLRFLEAQGIHHAYAEGHVWKNRMLAWHEAVIFSDPYQEEYLPYASTVDGADQPVFLLQRGLPETEGMLGALEALRVRSRQSEFGSLLVLHDFILPVPMLCVGSQQALTVRGDLPGRLVSEATDGDITTRWTTGRARQPGDTLLIEWAGTEALGGFLLLPGVYADVPSGFLLERSEDGTHWEEVHRVSHYRGPLFLSGPHPFLKLRRGRMEVRFEPARARHYRFTLLGGDPVFDWSVREIFPLIPCPAPPVDRSIMALLAALKGAEIDFVYADHWLTARLARDSQGRIGGRPSNANLNTYGWRPIPLDAFEAMKWGPRRAVVIEAEEGDRIATELRGAGITFRRTAVGGFALFTDLRRPKIGHPSGAWAGPVTWWGLGLLRNRWP